MLAAGLSIAGSQYFRCEVAMISMSDPALTSFCGGRPRSSVTHGSTHSTQSASNSRIRLSLYDRLDLISSDAPLNAVADFRYGNKPRR